MKVVRLVVRAGKPLLFKIAKEIAKEFRTLSIEITVTTKYFLDDNGIATQVTQTSALEVYIVMSIETSKEELDKLYKLMYKLCPYPACNFAVYH